jgi:hypothetical protein
MLFVMYNPDASYTGFHGASLSLLVAAAVLVIVWLLVFAQRYFATFPRLPDADPPTNDLRDEPPAVVNLLANRWKPTRIAMAATMLDLAARKVFDIQQLDSEHFVIHLERVPADESTLTSYERQVLDFVRARATGGSAPVEALTLGEEAEAEAWWKRFAEAVGKDATRLGLARNRWSPSDWAGLGGLLAVTLGALGLALALAHVGGGKSTSSSSDNFNPLYWLVAAFVGWAVVMGWLRSLRALRETPEGSTACAHWLGVRQYLHDTHGFDELPPAAVVIWERYLSYGAALGAAHDAVRALPFAIEEPGTAWSRSTGVWRQIRVEYPTRFGYGESPGKVFFGGLVRAVFWGALCFVALPVVTNVAYSIIKDVLTAEQRTSNQLYIVLGLGVFVIVAGAYLFIRFLAGVIRLVRGARDFGSTVTVEGPIVKAHQGRFAADDGKASEVDAWWPPAGTAQLARGMKVRVTMTPHLHHVTNITVLSTDGLQPSLDASTVVSAASVPPVVLDAARVNAITGLALQPVDASEVSRGSGGLIGAGASAAAFSDGTNMVAVARAPAAGPALALFGALSHVPGMKAAKVEGFAGDATWLGGRTLLVNSPEGLLMVLVNLPSTGPDRRLAIARELAAEAESPTPASPPAPA